MTVQKKKLSVAGNNITISGNNISSSGAGFQAPDPTIDPLSQIGKTGFITYHGTAGDNFSYIRNHEQLDTEGHWLNYALRQRNDGEATISCKSGQVINI